MEKVPYSSFSTFDLHNSIDPDSTGTLLIVWGPGIHPPVPTGSLEHPLLGIFP